MSKDISYRIRGVIKVSDEFEDPYVFIDDEDLVDLLAEFDGKQVTLNILAEGA